MRYFLASTLCRNVQLKQIVVIDKNITTIEGRAMELLESPQHRERVYALPAMWNKLDLRELLWDNLDGAVNSVDPYHRSYVELLESARDKARILARHRG